MISKLLAQLIKHKFTAGILLLVIAGGGYFGYTKIFSNDGAIRYATAQVQKGTLIVSISGSGQVSVSNQVDIKPKASGDIVYVGVKNGQEVKAGTLIAQLDARDAQKAVRDAETNLESAKLSLEKLKKPADALSILQAENSLAQAKESKQKAEDDLKKAYDDGFNTVANAFLDLPTVITGLHDILFSSDTGLGGSGQWNIDYYADSVKTYDEKALQYKEVARQNYQKAREEYDKNFASYKTITRYSDPAIIEGLINETYDTTKAIAEAVKSANNLIQFYQDKLTEKNLKPAALSNTHLSTLNTYTGKTNTHLLNLLGIKNTIKNSRDTIVNADRSIAEKTEFLAKLKAGADALDIQSAELTVKQRENALLDAKEKLADYFVRAPFDGVIAKINVEKRDFVSPSTVIAKIISRQKLAEISLNEIDVAQVKVGQEAILTFDSFPELEIRGRVIEISTVGREEQGVVSYEVKISLEKEDAEIKPGMTVSAKIFVHKKENALLVPNSAIKSDSEGQYVEIVKNYNLENKDFLRPAEIPQNFIEKRYIKAGISNDEFTEVLEGLKEGEVIIVRTLSRQAFQNQQQTNPFLPRLPFGQQRRQ
jgi:HlyD family secretion protein